MQKLEAKGDNMTYDLTTMKAIMENDKFALYFITKLTNKKKKLTYKGVRLDKRTNNQVEVYIEKTDQPQPEYRVSGCVKDREREYGFNGL